MILSYLCIIARGAIFIFFPLFFLVAVIGNRESISMKGLTGGIKVSIARYF